MLSKHKYIRSEAYKRGAEGQSCTLCGNNDGTVVLCHLNEHWAGKGRSIKSDDIASMDLCHQCHKKYDEPKLMLIEKWEITRAMYRTIKRRIEQGILIIK